ncbi:hypothetical protein CLOLEP_02371 [[Clostridium] leptum DSM 753]|uniref:Uncharacterized protein n=1 Tax=[Clostridium] leptum DSM 753 TaxID=428125 RepID=A7VUX3_9FIRM|nr:hypothetical protein CLOLEP_02371 [[Clostridium] leptum DSM 753]
MQIKQLHQKLLSADQPAWVSSENTFLFLVRKTAP